MPRQKAHTLYNIDKNGKNLKRTKQFCPRCSGSYLAEHKNRRSCGNCGYSEYKR